MIDHSQPISSSKIIIKYPWLFGWKHDCIFFIVPVFLAAAFFALSQYPPIMQSTICALLVLQAFGLGAAHQGATWFHYLDKRNRTHYRSSLKNLTIFLILPALILVLSIVGKLVCSALVFGIYVLWSIQHLVQQNVGILLLYHNYQAGEAIVNRKLEIRTLHSSAILCTSFFIYRILFHSTWEMPAIIFFAGLSAWTLTAISAYVIDLRKQLKEGAYLNMPALLFWLISVLSLVPFACFGRSYGDAFLMPLVIHWCQYLGLNYVLVKRKYANQDSIANLPLAKPVILFFVMWFVLVAITLSSAISASFETGGLQANVFLGFLLGMGMIHYFQDAFIWRFREQFPRESMLPYLRRVTT